MAHQAKLEIFKFHLKKKEDGTNVSFRQLMRYKLGMLQRAKPVSVSELFDEYFSNFRSQLNTKEFFVTPRIKKGIILAENENGTGKLVRKTVEANEWAISGVFRGGKYDLIRDIAKIDDANRFTPINPEDIICDYFYFLLYTPYDHHEGIIMVQSYSDETVSDVVRAFLQDYFKYGKEIKANIGPWIPEELQEMYRNGATFLLAEFDSNYLVQPDTDGRRKKTYNLEVKIIIKDKSSEPTTLENSKEVLGMLNRSKLKIDNSPTVELKDFPSTKAKILTATGRPALIDFDSNNEIKPTIYFQDMDVDPIVDGKLDFEIADLFCYDLLGRIKDELLPSNAANNV